jgi:hypothetical protein
MTPLLNAAQPIVLPNGTMQDSFRFWTQQVPVFYRGTGSPEGVVEAGTVPATFYIDTTGGAGAVLYVKRDADIAGDRTQGWILV